MFSRLFVRARPGGAIRPRIRASEQPRQPSLAELKAIYAEAVRGSEVTEQRDGSVA